jgi:hypothetical protein
LILLDRLSAVGYPLSAKTDDAAPTRLVSRPYQDLNSLFVNRAQLPGCSSTAQSTVHEIA